MKLDHLAVACTDLSQGVAFVEQKLGVQMQPGGHHIHFGTHNMLLGLGPDLYLEVIALDPTAKRTRPTWFGLDHFSGPPRLANWICAVDDLDAAVSKDPWVGQVTPLRRRNLAWKISVPPDGSLPQGGAYPTLIEWHAGTAHPATTLSDSNLRLTSFEIACPQSGHIADLLGPFDTRITYRAAQTFGFSATFVGPNGPVTLS